MQTYNPTQSQRSAALTYARKRWIDAHSLRFEGRCDVPRCRQWTLWSCQTESDHQRGDNEETCGYFCTVCGFSNAGARPVESDELNDND